MRHYLVQLVALLLVATVGGLAYWRLGNSHSAITSGKPAPNPIHVSQVAALSLLPASSANPVSVKAAVSAAAQAGPGWPGGNAKYLGRYRLTWSSSATLAHGGELTIFLRKGVPNQPKPILGGILALYGADGTNVLYLTHFEHTGAKLSARVNLGIYTGPVIGSFNVTSIHGNNMIASLSQVDGTVTSLHLTRFTTNPHP